MKFSPSQMKRIEMKRITNAPKCVPEPKEYGLHSWHMDYANFVVVGWMEKEGNEEKSGTGRDDTFSLKKTNKTEQRQRPTALKICESRGKMGWIQVKWALRREREMVKLFQKTKNKKQKTKKKKKRCLRFPWFPDSPPGSPPSFFVLESSPWDLPFSFVFAVIDCFAPGVGCGCTDERHWSGRADRFLEWLRQAKGFSIGIPTHLVGSVNNMMSPALVENLSSCLFTSLVFLGQ